MTETYILSLPPLLYANMLCARFKDTPSIQLEYRTPLVEHSNLCSEILNLAAYALEEFKKHYQGTTSNGTKEATRISDSVSRRLLPARHATLHSPSGLKSKGMFKVFNGQVQKYHIKAMKLSFTQGRWNYERWGGFDSISCNNAKPPGVELWAVFDVPLH
ncbi:uncharacterized protein [Glycine max]|uniref:uncharacterized protein isoform X2 n=1 Tax=Glycine max TaxID=3847 RepID=UPI001B357CE6|nr:uncharacterized protein LOC100797111 isoform X2 [Glycine max]